MTIVFEIPALHTLRRNPAVSREIVRKWRPPVEADDHIVGDLRASGFACGRCAGMISVPE